MSMMTMEVSVAYFISLIYRFTYTFFAEIMFDVIYFWIFEDSRSNRTLKAQKIEELSRQGVCDIKPCCCEDCYPCDYELIAKAQKLADAKAHALGWCTNRCGHPLCRNCRISNGNYPHLLFKMQKYRRSQYDLITYIWCKFEISRTQNSTNSRITWWTRILHWKMRWCLSPM